MPTEYELTNYDEFPLGDEVPQVRIKFATKGQQGASKWLEKDGNEEMVEAFADHFARIDNDDDGVFKIEYNQ